MGDVRQWAPFEEGWSHIKQKALVPFEAKLTSPLSPPDYARIYTMVYTLCNESNQNCTELYARHRQELERYMDTVSLPALKGKSGESLLTEFVIQYKNHLLLNRWYKKVFGYLDKWFVFLVDDESKPPLLTVEKAGLHYFKNKVFSTVSFEIAEIIVELVNDERAGKTVDKELIRTCLQVFEVMGMESLKTYILEFESALLESTFLFYQKMAELWTAYSVPAYLMEVETCIEKERALAMTCFNAEESCPKILSIVQQQLISLKAQQILCREDSGCRVLLDQDMFEDLSRMYRLFALLSDDAVGLIPMADLYIAHITEVGARYIRSRQNAIEAAEQQEQQQQAGAASSSSSSSTAKKDSNLSAKEIAEDPKFIVDMLNLYRKYETIVSDYFDNNLLFQNALKRAFTDLMNRDLSSSSSSSSSAPLGGKGQGQGQRMTDVLCGLCDRLLKGSGVTTSNNNSNNNNNSNESSSKLPESEVEDYLNRCVQLFSFLSDKDIFAELYRTQLSKRLLNQRSASQDMELFTVGKLKSQCGAQFTSKFEGMLNDLSLGVEHTQSFQQYFKDKTENTEKDVHEVDFSTQLLTAGYWPTYKSFDVTLPPVMQRCTEIFKEFYDAKNPQRRLQWVHTLGSVTMKCTFGSKSYDILLVPFQAAALSAFLVSTQREGLREGAENMTNVDRSKAGGSSTTGDRSNHATVAHAIPFEKLLTTLGMSEETLKRVLHSLSCGKFRVLKKIANHEGNSAGSSSGDKIIRSTDSFQVNDKFTSPVRKFRIPMANLDESSTDKRVEEDRSIAIEAAIVRIMKARKTLAHQQLVAEVLAQLIFFRPDPKIVKRRIEALIDREYIERDTDNPTFYKYLA